MSPALDIRFDIDKVETATNSRSYGFEAWRVFWGAIDPNWMAPAVLREGDTAATLRHQEHVFCIEVEALPDKLQDVQRALSTNFVFQRLAANPPFVNADSPATPVLAEVGRVVDGHLTGTGAAAAALEIAAGRAPAPPPPQVYAPATPPLHPALSAAVAEYSKRRYQVLTVPGAPGTMVTMDRRATRFNWLLTVALLILFGVGALVYVAIWAIWGVHRNYRVTLSVGPDGTVQELGDNLAVFDRDHLRAHRNRLVGFGAVLAAVAFFGLITTIGYPLDPGATDKLAVTATVGILFLAIPAGGASLLFRAARTATRKLKGQVR